MLRKLLEHTREELIQGFRKLHNEERHDKYYSVDQMKEDKTVGLCGSYGEI